MKTQNKIIILTLAMACLVLLSFPVGGQLPIGTIRKPIVTDSNGNVITTPITFSNQIVMAPAPSTAQHLVRYQDLTNTSVYLTGLTNLTVNPPLYQSGTSRAPILTWSNDSGFVTMTITNGLAGPSVTNGLASIAYANSVTQNVAQSSITNGLASITYVQGATQNLVTASITNGLASTGFVTGQGYVTQTVTNGLASASSVTNNAISLQSITNLQQGANVTLTKNTDHDWTIAATSGGASTNGLASIAYVDGATQNLATASITNGLASIGYVDSATNGLGGSVTLDSKGQVQMSNLPIFASRNMPMSYIQTGTNYNTFHQCAPNPAVSNYVVWIRNVEVVREDRGALSSDQVIRIYNVSGANTIFVTNGVVCGMTNISFSATNAWYARVENNGPIATNMTMMTNLSLKCTAGIDFEIRNK